MSATHISIEIDAPIQTVFEVVSDFEAYPEFLRDMRAVQIDKRGKDSLRATFTVSIIKKIRYTLEIALQAPLEISWKLVEGDMMKANTGGWKFEPLGKGKTKAHYQIEVSFGGLVPQSITDKLVGSNLPGMMQQFKERIEGLS